MHESNKSLIPFYYLQRRSNQSYANHYHIINLMPKTSHTTLRKYAALVWFIGVAVLGTKSCRLFLEAQENAVQTHWLILAILFGVTLGGIKGKYFFVKICNKNITRINRLKNPKIWQCYRVRFYFLLGLMVTFSSQTYAFAEGNGIALLLLAIIELSVGTALLVSSSCFWKTNKVS